MFLMMFCGFLVIYLFLGGFVEKLILRCVFFFLGGYDFLRAWKGLSSLAWTT